MDPRDDIAARLERLERQIAALRDEARALARRVETLETRRDRNGRLARPDRREIDGD